MASHDSSSSPPPLHPHHQQQPPLHHHYHQQQQSFQSILMAPLHQSDLNSYPISPYQHHHHHQPPPVQPLYHFNPEVTDGGALEESSSPPPPADGQVAFNIESAKRKRGRPRKNPIDGEGNNRVDLGLSPVPGTPVKSKTVRDLSGGGGAQTSEKRRGRPPGSVKKQIDSLGSSGTGFTPHVIIVNAGEDIASKIAQFTQQGPRTMCVLSANGFVSNCTLQQPGLSSRPVTYEGHFEIISLLGSSMLSESTNGLVRVGDLTVLLAGSDNRVLGGVAERLIAHAEVQVVVGTFIVQDVKKPKLTTTASQASIATNAAVAPLSYGGDQVSYGGDQVGYGGDQAGYGGDQVTVGASQQSGGGACSYSSDGELNSETNNGDGCYDNSRQQHMQKIPISLPMYGGWESSAKAGETTFPDVF